MSPSHLSPSGSLLAKSQHYHHPSRGDHQNQQGWCWVPSAWPAPPMSHTLGTQLPFPSLSLHITNTFSHLPSSHLSPEPCSCLHPIFCFKPAITWSTAVQDGDHQQSLALGPSSSCDALNPDRGIFFAFSYFLSCCQGSFTKRIVLFLKMSPINKDEYDLPIEIWGLL